MLDRTIEELRAVALDADDASGYLPAMYARVTARVERAAAAGQFGDADGMRRFAQAFASLYLVPRSGAAAPPACWRAAWDVAGDARLLIVQHLLLGINAHVNHDLPLVVVSLADEHGDLLGLGDDFDAVNTVLADTLPEVVRDLGAVSRWVNVAAARGGDRVFHFSLQAARAQAWQAAERLHTLDAPGRREMTAELDRLVCVLAYLVTRPAKPFGWLVWLARRLEADDPRAVTRRLLGELA